jgi:predicted nucleic acid binding AN1-type Zn finger protein
MEIETSFEQHCEQNYETVVGVRKPRQSCKYPECNFYAMKLIGQCNSCEHFYCQIHRIPETHKCKNLVELKNKERIKLANKLMSEKTIEKRLFL